MPKVNQCSTNKSFKTLKTSRVGHHLTTTKLQSFNSDIFLCAVKHLFEYIHRTASLRCNQTELFISYLKTHKVVSAHTISR